MYIPKPFKQEEDEEIISFIRENSFGILFSQIDQPDATHLPFILKNWEGGSCLYSHMARANRQWQKLNQEQVLVVFQGPHAYISPTWYAAENVVPTWNYTAVHVYGRFQIIEEKEKVLESLVEMTNFYETKESQPWQLPIGQEYVEQLSKGIVSFEIEITKLEAKWKLSQNHTPERRKRVIQELHNKQTDHSVSIATLMEKDLNSKAKK